MIDPNFGIYTVILAIGSFVICSLIAIKYEKYEYVLVGLGIVLIISIVAGFVTTAESNAQKEIYNKTVFQPWVKSLDSMSCEYLGDQVLKQKLLENKTAIDAAMKVFNAKKCHFDISSSEVSELWR